MMGESVGDVVELRIDALAAGGDGVGRTAAGRVVFVPRTAPGDRIRARIAALHPRYARAALEQILEPSPARVAPACAVFGECGGCSWQHVDYAVQCEAKRGIVEDALRRVGRLALPGARRDPALADRLRLSRARARGGGGRARRLSAREQPRAVRGEPLPDPLRARRRRSSPRSRAAPPARDGEWEIAAGAGAARAHEVGGAGPALELDVEGEKLRVSPGVFFQANPALHAALVESVARAAGRGALALELYAGCGFFTLALARAFERVIAVEADAAAVADLRHNLARASCASASRWCTAGRGGCSPRERARRDPPGRRRARPAAHGPRRAEPRPRSARSPPSGSPISPCDPATLARDLAALVAGGFALDAVEAFDLFPQTPHVEVLASLRR